MKDGRKTTAQSSTEHYEKSARVTYGCRDNEHNGANLASLKHADWGRARKVHGIALEIRTEKMHISWLGAGERQSRLSTRIDVAGAFDTVSHRQLRHNLHK